VYVSVLGDDRERDESLEGLESARGYLQSQVAAELRLKHTPQLDFRYDESVARGQRIQQLLREEPQEPPS
jgi:ribosome-binding factor A